MSSMELQIELEEYMVNRGVERYRDQQDKAVDTRAHETSAGSTLMRSYVLQVADYIQAYLDGELKGRRRGKYAKLLETLETDKIAMFALRSVIGAIYANPAYTMQTVCRNIGSACEDELRFTKFQAEYKEYYDSLIRDFDRKNTTSYKHQRRVLNAKGRDRGLEWREWTDEERAGVGQTVIGLLLECCDLVERKTKRVGRANVHSVVPTAACLEWIEKHNAFAEFTHPERMPCIIEPADWCGAMDGGYYTAQMRDKTPLITARSNKKQRNALIDNADMDQVYRAVNAAQKTPWTINGKVFDVLKEVWHKSLGCGLPSSKPFEIPACPLGPDDKADDLPPDCAKAKAFQEWKGMAREMHTREQERKAKCHSITRTVKLAAAMQEFETFWFVYQLDFRGRMYSTASGLSAQGTDPAKGILMFKRGKALGSDDGVMWFKINGANKYGYDKASYAGRVDWIDERREQWCGIADDPIGRRSEWAAADKPFQFLAWCFEYSEWCRKDGQGEGYEFISHLPVGLDGSCNGLQHFSAMLRDEVGGRAVNLCPSTEPNDIYGAVGRVCTGMLREAAALGEGGAINWLHQLPDQTVPRGLAKNPVMTLPYGSTQQACTQSIYGWGLDNELEFEKNTAFRHAIYLSPLLWQSIGEVVIAARAAMGWIQECSTILSNAGHQILYTSPLGFPVLQNSQKLEEYRIETQIGGRLQVRYKREAPALDKRRQRNGSSPNLVHHVDATHMMMAVCAALSVGIEDFALIHDDFGTHAADTATFQRLIQETFVRLHTDHNILANFKREHEERHGIELPDLPPMGDLDINDVLQSDYFFG